MTVRRFLIAASNRLTRLRRVRVAPSHLLLLAPHCLQRSGCRQPVTDDLDACKRCGGCRVADLLDLCHAYGIRGHLVGGGRRALEKVADPKVKAVVAVACERELFAGIVAAFPKPVLAVSNELPNGPCRDTSVNLAAVQTAINELLQPPPDIIPGTTSPAGDGARQPKGGPADSGPADQGGLPVALRFADG